MAFMPKIDELENLLEAYFVQIDGTLNKLSAVRPFSCPADAFNFNPCRALKKRLISWFIHGLV